ncbi:MAG: hypothetical protein JSR54_00475 [Proteobacteria bacterium]|nr:hypothetical protein [Pseudomonadota bacterium]
MPIENARDPRVTLLRDKYFTMRPKPLERWLWQQGLPASAERVYWYHWDLGAQNGTWCSQVPLRLVARDCCLDPATVTRAYQLLRRLDLLRRQDPGRDPGNPFQQATAVTEVRVPRELVTRLAQAPNRRAGPAAAVAGPALPAADAPAPASQPNAAGTDPAGVAPSRDESRRIFSKLSAGERTRFSSASAHRRTSLEFDADTRLSPTDRAHVLATLESLARARPAAATAPAAATPRAHRALPRRLTAVEVLKVQSGLRTLASARAEVPSAALLGEIVYAAEEGALAKFPVPLALNIALKKVREGLWSSPYRMPPDWSARRALPETCAAAGQI